MVFSYNKNYKKTFNSPLLEIYKEQAKELVKKLTEENFKLIYRPKIPVLHSGLFKTSNTLMLWKMLKENLYGKDIGDKTLFSVIASGNSGSDCVAKQLIGALNINKGFRLPPYFVLTATANGPRSIINILGIDKKAKEFAENIKKEIKK